METGTLRLSRKPGLPKIMIAVFTTLAVIYIGLCLALFIFQKSLLYFPTGASEIITGEPHVFHVNDQQINAVLLNPGLDQAVVYFGGNAEQIEETVSDFRNYQQHTFYFVNYRGYGGSSGEPHKKGILDDVHKILDDIHDNHSQVILIGRSLGSGIATYLANQKEIPQVILITPYDSIEKVASDNFSLFPVKFLLTQNYNSLEYIRGIDTQFTVIYSENDRVIPSQNTENLISHMKIEPRVINIPQADHNSISSYPEFWQEIDRVLKNNK